MRTYLVCFILLFCIAVSVTAQQSEEWSQWTPEKEQFKLYVNVVGTPDSIGPKILILNEDGSWPFLMQRFGDTVFLFLAPPGYELTEQSSVDSLPDEFPFVTWAGTERSTFWFSYDSGQVEIDTLVPALFITVQDVILLDEDIAFLQLKGTGKSAKTIKRVLGDLKGVAELVQLESGFYETILEPVTTNLIRRWKLNKTAIGTLLFFRILEPSNRVVVDSIISTYR